MTHLPETIQTLLQAARLPALPQALIKLMALCQSDDAGMAELAEVIATDAALSSRLLKVAHSAAYHRGDGQLNLLQAANTLGTDMIKVLAISESVIQTLAAFGSPGNLDLRPFWKHSLTAAMLARALAQQQDYPAVDDAYLAGLLHDVGRLALMICSPLTCQGHFLTLDDQTLCATEQQELGFTHAQAGAWLINQWHLSAEIAEAVLHHHEPVSQLNGSSPLVRILSLTHQLQQWVPANSEDLPEMDTGGALDGETMQQLLEDASHQVLRTAHDLGIDISEPIASPVQAAYIANPAQQQLAQEVQTRSLFNEMSQQLAQHNSVVTLLTAVREHAALLLGLDDTLVMLLGEDSHSLACVSVSAKHFNLAVLSVDSRQHPVLMHCLQQKTLSVSDDQTAGNTEICRLLSTQHVVAVPLLTAKQVLGLLVSAVSDTQLTQLQSQTRFLQAFGLHAGSALSRHLQSVQALDAQIANLKREQLINARQLAHEVQNPLSIIQNYLSLMDEKIPATQPERAELSVISGEVQRVGHIIEQFTLSADALVLEPIDMARVVRELVLLLQASRFFPADIKLQCEWPASTHQVMGSADMVKQVLINLIKNARESMPDGGHIVVSGGAMIKQADKPFIQICVSDTGPGLDAQQQSRMFHPVTSDKHGPNRGLGLSVVQQLVQKMQGQIRYRSSPQGVSFEVLLPAVHS